MSVTRRAATEHDYELCRSIHHRAYEDVVTRQFGRWDLPEQDAFFANAWQLEGSQIILLTGEPAGYCVIEEREDDIHVRELVVDPTFQGRGIGTNLLRETIDRASARSVPIVLGTFHANRARVLYERVGFTVFDEDETHVFMRYDGS